ncbi:MAG: acyltransferase [Candidatus Obscuribacterales bacterium]|nr:acyltransferase [Candidatus Obscuribacterales bacterium]
MVDSFDFALDPDAARFHTPSIVAMLMIDSQTTVQDKPRLQTPVASQASVTQSLRPSKLDALTSLRFLAAAVIVMFHVAGSFNIYYGSFLENLGLWQGVTCFFVLSGFIMFYVHPELNDSKSTDSFFVARFARIWPSYFASLCFFVALKPSSLQAPNAVLIAVANILMVQSWTLIKPFYKLFNNPGWSVSTEAFFYLCFPMLLQRFKETWKSKLGICLVLGALSIGVAYIAEFPAYAGILPRQINVNPLCRLFEFVTGMIVCLAYNRYGMKIAWGKSVATLFELVSIAFVAMAVLLTLVWQTTSETVWLEPIRIWLSYCGVAPIYGFLIFVFAIQKGYISQLLTRKAFVKLGEISFSIYLFHLPILLYFSENYERRREGSLIPTVLIACVLCFTMAVTNFILIEHPARRFILGLWKKFQTKSNESAKALAASCWRMSKTEKSWLAGVSIIAVLCCLAAVKLDRQFRFAPESAAQRVAASSPAEYRNVIFGDALNLRGVSKRVDSKGMTLTLAWQSLKSQKLDCLNVVQLIDKRGVVKGNDDYWQDRSARTVHHGQIWTDSLFFTNTELQNVRAIGLKIANIKLCREMPITAGSVKPGDTRLLVQIN